MLRVKKDFTVEVNELNLFKIMNPNYDDAIRGHIKDGLKTIIPKVNEMVRPEVHYGYKENKVFVFVTLGDDVDHIAKELWGDDEYFNALLLDHYLTQYLFDLSRAFYRELKQEVLIDNKGLGKRQTPGDELPLEDNKLVMDTLKSLGDFSGTVNDSFVLTPAKSLAYYYNIEDAFSCLNEDLNCQDCNRDTCLMR